MTYEVTRHHDFSCGHRVVGHEGKCRLLHGHNYRAHFTCQVAPRVRGDSARTLATPGGLDDVGRVIDFSVIKSRLCAWLEDHWDHRTLLWSADDAMRDAVGAGQNALTETADVVTFVNSFVFVPFNPTAENMARHLVDVVGPEVLAGTGCWLVRVEIEETRKCRAAYDLR